MYRTDHLSFVGRHLAAGPIPKASSRSPMAETLRSPVVGDFPPTHQPRRLDERRARERTKRLERRRKPDKPDDFVTYEDSDSDEDTPFQKSNTLRTSFSVVDYLRSRESQHGHERRTFNPQYANHHLLTNDMYKERPVVLGNCNKVFCSQWLNHRQVVFGTKCNKLMVYDVNSRRFDAIPTITSCYSDVPESQNGIHAIQMNPSRSLLATGGHNSADVGLYTLPTFGPVAIGTSWHRDWIMDMCWLDDQFLVTGSRDSKMALWRMPHEILDGERPTPAAGLPVGAAKREPAADSDNDDADAEKPFVDEITHLVPMVIKDCRSSQKIRSLCFNPVYREIVVISLNGYIHLFNAETFTQLLSRKLPNCQDNVCITHQPNGLYAVGCRSYTLLLDPRTLQVVRKIASRYSGCGIRSASFQDNILTVGTGLGMLMFYDVRAGKYLESSINSSRTVVLKASKGYVFPEEEMEGFRHIKYVPAIYTHCYDASGTRLFSAGGPLPANLVGNYAGIWQ